MATYTPFKQMEAKLAQRPGVTDPGGLAAYLAKRKYGKKKVQRAAATGTNLRNAKPHPQSYAAQMAKRHGK